jgi:SAM-dependent methyltransferase
MGPDLPLLYRDLAPWFTLLTAPEDYAEEAEAYRKILSGVSHPPRTVLELGSGAGNNASHLKAHFEMTLVDLSPEMLSVSMEQNPECAHEQGDMRTVRLGHSFDAVFVHDAVMYLRSEADLALAVETAFVHTRPGGVALFVPDCVRETFRPATSTGGHDRGKKGLRYLEWTWDPDPGDSTFVSDFAYLLREEDGSVRSISERHVVGLFPRKTWLGLLSEAGFSAQRVGIELADLEPCSYEGFLGLRER